MTTTKTIRPGQTLIIRDGQSIGTVSHLGLSYRAVRKQGTATDARRVAQGFRTVEAATAWIEKAS